MHSLRQYLDAIPTQKGWREVADANFIINTVDWKSGVWEHDLTLHSPEKLLSIDTAILFLSGDRVDPADHQISQNLAEESGLYLFTLFGIPNQPLWEMREDDLIAHTFDQYLSETTKDTTWPLLFPMTAAVLAAMDLIQAQFPHVARFVVTGASKRAWTTWLVGCAGDGRVIGICPQVFDHLNMVVQLKRQLEIWGEFSAKLDDYARRQFHQILDTEEGRAIAELVDPFSYLSELRCPVHIVNGSNDEYWLVDALSQYVDQVPTKTTSYTTPNFGHDLQFCPEVWRSIGEFALACALGKPFGDWGSYLGEQVWFAAAEDYRFAEASWTNEAPESGRYLASFKTRDHYGIKGQYPVSDPVQVTDRGLETKSPKVSKRPKKVASGL